MPTTTKDEAARTPGQDGADSLNDRLRAAGMFTIPEMLGETPLTRWETVVGMTNLDFFERWLEAQVRQYISMRMKRELGDEERDELYEWVLAHSAAFRTILVNFRAARAGAPAPASPGVPDSLRALSEAASAGPFSVSGARKRYNEASCVIVDAPSCPGLFAFATADGREALAALADAKFFVAAANYVRTLLSTHPAGQSAGSGAETTRVERPYAYCCNMDPATCDCVNPNHGTALFEVKQPAPDSTRTGDEGTEETVAVPASALRWLFGEGPDADGVWFGDQNRGKGAFWWRSEFRKRIEAARPAAPEAQGAWCFDMEASMWDGQPFLIAFDRGMYGDISRAPAVVFWDERSQIFRHWHHPQAPVQGKPVAYAPLPAPPASSGQEG